VLVADYFHREALFQVDRFFSRSIDQRRQGGSSFLSSVANPGTVFDPVTGDPLKVPADSDGTPEIAEFEPGRNRFDRAPFQPLVPETERYGVYTRGKVRLAPAVICLLSSVTATSLPNNSSLPRPSKGMSKTSPCPRQIHSILSVRTWFFVIASRKPARASMRLTPMCIAWSRA
jgi:hypothetical protein